MNPNAQSPVPATTDAGPHVIEGAPLVTDELTNLVLGRVAPVAGAGVASMVDRLLRDTASTVMWKGDEAVLTTGDIPALWLRDSSAQFAPFLRLLPHLPPSAAGPVVGTCRGLLRRQWRMICEDPYANAFLVEPGGPRWDPDDRPEPGPWVWERKFELDSLAFPVLLARRLVESTGLTVLDAPMAAALARVVEVYDVETAHGERSDYWFHRSDCPPTDTLAEDGRGTPSAAVGLIWAGFRPSDDACEHHFNIPGNLFAAHALKAVADLAVRTRADSTWRGAGVEPVALAGRAQALADSVVEAVRRHGIVDGPLGKPVLAYEVDGLGRHLIMDDANNPSLMGLPYLGALPAGMEQLWRDTREVLLSDQNPWFFRGKVLSGIGSPHTGPGRVWPIALATQALSGGSRDEMLATIELLATTTAGTGQMHEGIDVDDPSRYTREWFSWANAMFCELVLACSGL